ncbi:chemotaxis protein CheW [Hephaestia mangrovi]|uniref:chemotaxis protein CheW n=1 Tax=Hephaestia mangrovi TaxID=2873268 RepID=UPI001CA74B4F|nr:chemotaxis protein CheW [Hephaestia mangrovi]MBY8827115.1 chemotaxis protein CheW [Hephaestia mangrovi]
MADLFLIAEIAGRPVAIASDQVESVVDIGEVVPVPRADARVRGLAALRSRVVTVIDTRAVLGLNGGDMQSRAVITAIEGHHYAVLVDALEDVTPCALQPLAGGIVLDPAWRPIGCGIVELGGEPVLAIDLRAMIPGLAVAA